MYICDGLVLNLPPENKPWNVINNLILKLMKKTILFLLFTLFISCNSDDSSESSTINLLTENSPWTFDHYQMLNIVDAGSSVITQQEIEDDINSSLNGLSLTFNPDGSGFTSSVGEPNENWEWEIISNNQLKIIYDGGEFEIFNNLNVTSTLLKMELESVTYDSDVNYEVSHYGIYHFD